MKEATFNDLVVTDAPCDGCGNRTGQLIDCDDRKHGRRRGRICWRCYERES